MKEKNKFTRKNAQPRHSLSNKFTPKNPRTLRDLQGMVRGILYSEGCEERNPNFEPYGKMDGLTWWVVTGGILEDSAGRKRPEYKRAVQMFFEEALGRELENGEILRKVCPTKGCMNIKHYRLKEKIVVSREQARIFYEMAVTAGKATLPYHDSDRARQERLGFYPHRTWFKKHDPLFYEQIENMELVIRDGALVCQPKGSDAVTADAWAEANLPTQSAAKVQEELLQEAMEEIREKEGRKENPADQVDAVLAEEGYGVPVPDNKLHDMSDKEDFGQEMDGIIAKFERGEMLSPEENKKLMSFKEREGC